MALQQFPVVRPLVGLALLVALVFPAAAGLADQATERTEQGCTLRPGTQCLQWEAQTADLNSVNLSGANLRDADLAFAKLMEANLSGADLSGVTLYGAQALLVNLSGANLTGANLSGIDLTNANLAGANLTNTNLTNADLTGADLARTNLTGANLTATNLAGANLLEANLGRANLARTNLAYAQTYGVTHEGAVFEATICPSGINSDSAARTCAGHFSSAPPQTGEDPRLLTPLPTLAPTGQQGTPPTPAGAAPR